MQEKINTKKGGKPMTKAFRLKMEIDDGLITATYKDPDGKTRILDTCDKSAAVEFMAVAACEYLDIKTAVGVELVDPTPDHLGFDIGIGADMSALTILFDQADPLHAINEFLTKTLPELLEVFRAQFKVAMDSGQIKYEKNDSPDIRRLKLRSSHLYYQTIISIAATVQGLERLGDNLQINKK